MTKSVDAVVADALQLTAEERARVADTCSRVLAKIQIVNRHGPLRWNAASPKLRVAVPDLFRPRMPSLAHVPRLSDRLPC